MKKIFACFYIVALFASCGNNNMKKILVMTKGKATIDKDAKTIAATGGGTSHEQDSIEYNTSDKITLEVTSATGKTSVDIPDKGYYILNAKTDTIVGSFQNYVAPENRETRITQVDLQHRIDSLQQLIAGQNINAANKNYFILPNHAVKITDNVDAFIVGPYHQMTSVAEENGKTPEVYRFYTNSEIRETIAHLKSLTIAPPSPNQ